jgi:hypothetical protein
MRLLWMAIFTPHKHPTLKKELQVHPEGRLKETSKELVSSSKSILLRGVHDVISSQ